jgi:hypothetical protein
MSHYAGMKRTAVTLVLLTACAVGQSVVLAPPDQQVHPKEHTGTFTATYHPPVKNTMKPTVVLGSGLDEQNCYVTYDFENVPHSWCEHAHGATGRTDMHLYLHNFHGANREFTALLAEGSKCDPLRAIADSVMRSAFDNENTQVTSTFEYQEKGRSDISVACSYVDSKGFTKAGTAKYNVI